MLLINGKIIGMEPIDVAQLTRFPNIGKAMAKVCPISSTTKDQTIHTM